MNRPILFVFAFAITAFLMVISFVSCQREDNDEYDYPLSNPWITVYENSSYDLYSINFLNDSVGYIIGGLSGVHTNPNWQFIIKTYDAGETWVEDSCIIPGDVDIIINIFPLNNQLLGTGYSLYTSADEGKIWELNSQFEWGGPISDLFVIDPGTWLIEKGSRILLTNDSGHSWDTVFRTNFLGPLQKFTFPTSNSGFGYFGTVRYESNLSAGLIVRTLDAGRSWYILRPEPWKSDGKLLPYIIALQFIDGSIGYLITLDYELYKTNDGGLHWDKINHEIICTGPMYFFSEKVGICSDGFNIHLTKDGGVSWVVESNVHSQILDWTFLENDVGFAITADSKIFKRINSF